VTARADWPLLAGPLASALLAVAAVVETTLRAGNDRPGDLSLLLLLCLGATVPLAFIRTWAVHAAVPVAAAVFLMLVVEGWLPVAALVAHAVATYLLARSGPRWAVLLVVVPFLAYAAARVVGETDAGPASGPANGPADEATVHPTPVAILVVAVVTATAAVLGWAGRVRREAVVRDASRQAIADSLLEHAARGERARIARELHDVVAHHISMIAVQAETARLTTPGMPADGAKRLLAIGDTARTALTEMRRLLGVLREDAAPGQVVPTRAPQPGLEQLNELIDEARESGPSSARLIVSGRVVPLDPGIQLTAYRVVQEALTNARRHAVGAAVDVELRYDVDALRIQVRDNGPGPAVPRGTAAGHGLLGMRERVGVVGGTLRVGPGQPGGFVVDVVLPFPEVTT
jgi:signal transduction histidine kinase